MSINLQAIINKFKSKGDDKKSIRQIRIIQRKTTGVHRFAASHWLFAKLSLILLVIVISAFQYVLYMRISKEAFNSTAGVEPVGTSNIDADELFSVLTNERKRSDEFASSIEKGPISFDPSRYDIVLGKQVGAEESSAPTTSAPIIEL